MREIPLGSGFVANIDEEDFELVSQYKWRIKKVKNETPYAQTHIYNENGKRTTITMHRLLLGFPPDVVDHRDRNGLNNVRHNLRVATRGQNVCNTPRRRCNTSGYKGVSRRGKGWLAQIETRINGFRKSIHLGVKDTPEEAACLYDIAAKKYFGDFAYLNFPQELSTSIAAQTVHKGILA